MDTDATNGTMTEVFDEKPLSFPCADADVVHTVRLSVGHQNSIVGGKSYTIAASEIIALLEKNRPQVGG